jgi:hypothetical protein
MGQKANPNSFNQANYTVFSNSFFSSKEYAKLFFNNYAVNSVIRALFEKNGCLIKNCYILFDTKRNSLILYLSAFVLKPQQSNSKAVNVQNRILKTSILLQKSLFNCFKVYGLHYKKRFIFHNLNQSFANVKVNVSSLQRFKRELYYYPSVSLLKILHSSSNNSILLAKFVAKFFKLFHRSKKGNKFFFFLAIFSQLVVRMPSRIKGIKIQIKGRLRGAPRSKIRVIQYGVVPLQTINSSISYSLVHTHTTYGSFGIKVWINDQ